MARSLTQPWRRIIQYQTPSRWWLEESLESSHFLVKSEVKSPSISCVRFSSSQASAPAPAQGHRGPAIKAFATSPGFLADPYSPREPVSLLHRLFTRSGWKRTKDEFFSELQSAYAIAKVRRKYGYSKRNFYAETADIYREINSLMANGDKKSLRRFVTEHMYSALKNEIKHRETVWARVHWELIIPMVKTRTLRARLISTDRTDTMKSIAQITVEFLSKQKFEAYDSKGAVVAGDKDKEILVRDIWVFERSLFHEGSYWRLCGRIKL